MEGRGVVWGRLQGLYESAGEDEGARLCGQGEF